MHTFISHRPITAAATPLQYSISVKLYRTAARRRSLKYLLFLGPNPSQHHQIYWFSAPPLPGRKKKGKVEEVGKTRRSPDLPTHRKRKEKNYEEGKEREAEGIGHAKRVA